MLLFLLLGLLLPCLSVSLSLPTRFVSEPSASHPAPLPSLSPWVSLLLDIVDALLKSAQTAADGQTIKVSKLLEDVHVVVSSPAGVSALRMAALPYWMNNCRGGEGCKPVLATDFIRPCYQRGATLEAMVSDFKTQVSFLDFASLHSVHPERLASVQLPVQLVLLRVIEAVSVVSADEWREVIGRALHGCSVWTDILSFFINNGIRDIRSAKRHSVNAQLVAEMAQSARSLSTLTAAVTKHGLTGLFESAPLVVQAITQRMATTYGIELGGRLGGRQENPIRDYSKVFVSPPKFAAFVLAYVDRVAQMFGFNGHLDLSQVQLDVTTEAIVGMSMDYLKLLYAMLQGVVERDAALWMAAHKTTFEQYLDQLKRSDGHESFEDDSLQSTLRTVLRDKRQRRCLKQLFLPVANLVQYQGDPMIGKDFTQRVVAFLDDPFSADQGGESIGAFFKDVALRVVLHRFDWFTIATRALGFRPSEWDTLFRFLSKIVGSTASYWNPDERTRVAGLRLPQWAWAFDRHLNASAYWIRIWAALIPPKIDVPPDVLMLPQSLKQLLDHSLARINQMVLDLPESADKHHVDDDLLALLSAPSTLASLVTVLHVQGGLVDMLTGALGLHSATLSHDLALVFSDLATLDPERCRSNLARFLVTFCTKFMVVWGTAAGWRAQKEAAMRLSWDDTRSHERPFVAFMLPRFMVRLVLASVSVALLCLAVSILRAPRGTRSLKKAIKWD